MLKFCLAIPGEREMQIGRELTVPKGDFDALNLVWSIGDKLLVALHLALIEENILFGVLEERPLRTSPEQGSDKIGFAGSDHSSLALIALSHLLTPSCRCRKLWGNISELLDALPHDSEVIGRLRSAGPKCVPNAGLVPFHTNTL